MHDPFCYSFRFCCDPGFNDVTEIESLSRFVTAARIDDVMVFVNVEEINTGHFDDREQEVYLDLLRRIAPMLSEKGVTMSVNHWHSIMHADLGKSFRADQPFRPMVDVDGNSANLCVCPLCTAWQGYIANVYQKYAALHPDTVWVEDDFRFHNHDPLVWGGCFCDEHMKRYSEKAAKPLTREEFIAGVLQPGQVHPYRKIWLDTARETLEQAAKNIGDAVHAVSPHTKVGLMSSVPYVHSAEGRNWKKLLSCFAGKNASVDRIHLPAYQELAPWQYLQAFHMVSMVNRAFLSPDTLVYPELENYPYSRFSKSRRFTRFQLLSALPLDVAGMTIDLFDLNGRGIIWQDGYQDMLRDTKDFLNRINALGAFKQKKEGVCVLVDEAASYHLHTRDGVSMEELYPEEVFWAGLLPAMGVPFYIGTAPSDAEGLVAISGQYLRNLTEAAVTKLFADNFVLLNGDAIAVLCDRNLSYLIGVESVRWMQQNSGEYAFEQVTNGRVYTGVENARASAIISAADAVDVTYAPDAMQYEYTSFYDSFRNRKCPAEVMVNDRAFIYPFGHFASPQDIPPMLRNDVRQEILHDMLFRSGQFRLPMVVNSPYLMPYCNSADDALYLYLVNGSLDDVAEVQLVLPFLFNGITPALEIYESNGTVREDAARISCGKCTLPLSIPAMESAMVILK